MLKYKKTLTNNNNIIYKNNNIKHLQILEAISIKIKQSSINKTAFNTGTNKVNIFNK